MTRSRVAPARFDDEAARRWRRLIKAARAQAASLVVLSEAAKAGRSAMKAASIPGQHIKGSAALQLCRQAQAYAGLHAAQRAEARAALADLADAVERALEAATVSTARRERADLEG